MKNIFSILILFALIPQASYAFCLFGCEQKTEFDILLDKFKAGTALKIKEIDNLFGKVELDSQGKLVKKTRKETLEALQKSTDALAQYLVKLHGENEKLKVHVNGFQGLASIADGEVPKVKDLVEEPVKFLKNMKYSPELIAEECRNQEAIYPANSAITEEKVDVSIEDQIENTTKPIDGMVSELKSFRELLQKVKDRSDESSNTHKQMLKELVQIEAIRGSSDSLVSEVNRVKGEIKALFETYALKFMAKRKALLAEVEPSKRLCAASAQYLKSVSTAVGSVKLTPADATQVDNLARAHEELIRAQRER